jgi:hypothetical protein
LTESNLIVASLWRQRIKQALKEGYARGLMKRCGNIRVLGRHIVSRGNGLLVKTRHRTREIYDSDDGALILLYDPSRSRVILVRQFRLPAFLRRGHESLIEVRAGKREGEDANSRMSKEAEEETRFWCEIRAASSNFK